MVGTSNLSVPEMAIECDSGTFSFEVLKNDWVLAFIVLLYFVYVCYWDDTPKQLISN